MWKMTVKSGAYLCLSHLKKKKIVGVLFQKQFFLGMGYRNSVIQCKFLENFVDFMHNLSLVFVLRNSREAQENFGILC